MIKKIVCLILLYLCISCSNNISNSDIDKNKNLQNNPEILYKLAKLNFDSKNFELAREQFKEINKLFPLSNEAIQSEIMIAFIDYIQMDYENAILNNCKNNIFILGEANNYSLKKIINKNKKSVVLIDIEGMEYQFLNDKTLYLLKSLYLQN